MSFPPCSLHLCLFQVFGDEPFEVLRSECSLQDGVSELIAQIRPVAFLACCCCLRNLWKFLRDLHGPENHLVPRRWLLILLHSPPQVSLLLLSLLMPSLHPPRYLVFDLLAHRLRYLGVDQRTLLQYDADFVRIRLMVCETWVWQFLLRLGRQSRSPLGVALVCLT